MEHIYIFNGLPIKSWIKNEEIDDKTHAQVNNIANLPFAFHHVAIMPDGHMGYGMPIGGVLATKNYIVPNAVGADIGCGMNVTCLDLKKISNKNLIDIRNLIKETIPTGISKQSIPFPDKSMPGGVDIKTLVEKGVLNRNSIISKNYENAKLQLGTLGGGNHFIEIQKGNDNFIWLMIHSGSRNLGYKIAKYYNQAAIDLNAQWYSSVPKSHELAFLPTNTKICEDYIKEMEYAIYYGRLNRATMQQSVIKCFKKILGNDLKTLDDYDIAHNYTSLENHFGNNVWVHRKGATAAYEDQIGIIPGSQGSNSYIVKGLGNKDSFMSCSHGAGRTMGRNEAKKILNLDEEQAKLSGIIHDMNSVSKLDEAPGSYKDIISVMAAQKDLVKILVELTPLAVVKG